MDRPVAAVLVGAGNRGADAYGPYALEHPERLTFVAVAEPDEGRRVGFAASHGIPQERQFSTWQQLLDRRAVADAAFICTQDAMHVGPTLAALALGYDVLLEKPMATSLADCVRLAEAAERAGRLLQVCHVLRYTPFFSALHQVIDSGRLGPIVTVAHRENVSYWHMAHSYVRGHWANRRLSSPMILAKCCHDLDILYWNLGSCERLSSFGSLLHYRSERAPEGAPERCTDGCPAAEHCPWYAPRVYIDLTPLRHNTPQAAIPSDYAGWPRSVVSGEVTPEALWHALEQSPYGRCVYHCDNDVVDHQVVSMRMESGASVTLTMHGHSHREGRTMRYDGTRATLRGIYTFDEQRLKIIDHLTGETEVKTFDPGPFGGTGHGQGDFGLVEGFVQAIRDPSAGLTTARESLESHVMAFAAEDARTRGVVVDVAAFRRATSGPTSSVSP